MKILSTLLLLFFLITPTAFATEEPGKVPEQTGIDEKLGEFVDLNIKLRGQDGVERPIKEYFPDNRPVIITPVYFNCPNLCGLTLMATLKMLREIELDLGDDFFVLSVSFKPEETANLAQEKAKNYYEQLKFPETGEKGWRFLTGSSENVSKLMQQIGFKYRRDGEDYIHSAVITVLSPKGKVSRYFYGVEYPPKDVKFSLVEASKGRIGNTIDRILVYCFTYDASTGKYTPLIWNITQIVCLTVVVILIAGIVWMVWKDKRKGRKQADV